jgi:phosphoglycerate dehydrogenase-like enzyme
MTLTVLYVLHPEKPYPDDSVERRIFGDGVRVRMPGVGTLAAVEDEVAAETDGLMTIGCWVGDADLARFPRLKVIVRMGVGYDRIDRQAAAARGIMVCNTPDYGTTEVADHAIALALALRRGIVLHHDAQRRAEPAAWQAIATPLVRRSGTQTFGVLGLGRIGTAAALRARALGFRVVFHDPHRPPGTELALGLERAATLDELLAQSDVLSLHAPLTRTTRGLIGARELALLPEGAVIVNTARGPILDLDALEAALREGHIAAAGLDVLPVEPPAEPPALLRAYRARESWLEGRLVVTPHSAFYSQQSVADIRTKSAETMRAALLTGTPQNVITPDME